MDIRPVLSDHAHKRLLKLLAISDSSNDREALSAIRAANKLLKKTNTTWSEVVTNGVDASQLLSHLLSRHW